MKNTNINKLYTFNNIKKQADFQNPAVETLPKNSIATVMTIKIVV